MLIFFTNEKPTVAIGAKKVDKKIEEQIKRSLNGTRRFRDPEYYHIAIVVGNERSDLFIESGKTILECDRIFQAVRIMFRSVVSEYHDRYARTLPQIIISLFGPENEILMNYVQHEGRRWGQLQDLVPEILQ